MGGICQVIAHRGASRQARENTVVAFERAGILGADAVELDVRRTADGVLIVHHDAQFADGRLVGETAVGELPRHVPTLGAALDACGSMWVNVEIKNDPRDPDHDPDDTIADETVAHLLARDEDRRWLISSFRIETIDRCRAVAPTIRTGSLLVDVEPGDIDEIASRGHVALHPWVGALTEDVVQRAHAAGLAVTTWTCDDEMRMEQLLAWGVDGICTNVPDVALRVRGRGEAAPT